MAKTVIDVEGMTCGHCKSSVEGALHNLDGVSTAEVNLEKNNVTVEYNDTIIDRGKMTAAIEDQGYDVKQ
ncbi:copper chaperone CopZ [Jeotgalicoccus coquinae]|uniref:Copper chaperone CopZ n=1 Tax=Jeotgalicoccus coquinae TaxID=709509 RepID=A0A6V7RQZ7_9STAP|nr:copper chaperone CopZ [Jeotgalicoccus coquinae]MBB6423996.1 copper chaperone [Jeotgalicoccus coquinae]GGE23326.1 copper chaperone CopZ [Jeotgalicoccus coquinae]CAD2080141.1 Copper chaperone CopZ [Jeotgalicoccus coquinae]